MSFTVVTPERISSAPRNSVPTRAISRVRCGMTGMSSRVAQTQMERFSAIPGISASDICVCALTRPGYYDSVGIAHDLRARIFTAELRKRAHVRDPFARNGDRAAGNIARRAHRQDMASANQCDGLAHRVSFAYRAP